MANDRDPWASITFDEETADPGTTDPWAGLSFDQEEDVPADPGPMLTDEVQRLDEPAPLEEESFGATVRRRGQQVAQGATEVFASVPESAAILNKDLSQGSRDPAVNALLAQRQMILNESRVAPEADRATRDAVFAQTNQQIAAIDARIAALRAGEQAAADAPESASDTALFKAGDRLRAASAEAFGTPDPRDDSFGGKLAQGAGSMVGFMGAGLAGGLAGGAVGAAGLGGLMGASSNSAQIYKEALQYGADEETALSAARVAGALGATEIVPIQRALSVLPRKVRAEVGNALFKRLKKIAQASGEEAAQEFIQGVGNNLIAQNYYDPDRGVMQDVGEQVLIGAILGGGMGTVGQILTPADEASPLPNELIASGKEQIDDILTDRPAVPEGATDADVLLGADPEPVEPNFMERRLASIGDRPLDGPQVPQQPAEPLVLSPDDLVPPPEIVTPDQGVVPSEPEISNDISVAPPEDVPLEPEGVPSEPDPAPTGRGNNVEVLNSETVGQIGTDAETFQYKGGGNAEGVTDRFEGTEPWKRLNSGIGIIYEYEDGRRVIVDGHQRLNLAKQAGARGEDVEFSVHVLREADGVSPQEARALGAEKNIAEGSGDSLDAAKVFRDTGRSPKDLGIPRRSAMVQEAEGLAELSDDAFGMVNNNVAKTRDGALVGRLVDDPVKHSDILGLLTRIKPGSAVEAEAIIRQAREAEVTETQASLFGEEEVSVNLYEERAKILSRTMSDLGKEISTFRTLTDRGEAITDAGNVLNQQSNEGRLDQAARNRQVLMVDANRKGPISDALTEAARAVRDGEPIARAARSFAAALKKPEDVGQGGGAAPRDSGASDGPSAPESGARGQGGVDAPADLVPRTLSPSETPVETTRPPSQPDQPATAGPVAGDDASAGSPVQGGADPVAQSDTGASVRDHSAKSVLVTGLGTQSPTEAKKLLGLSEKLMVSWNGKAGGFVVAKKHRAKVEGALEGINAQASPSPDPQPIRPGVGSQPATSPEASATDADSSSAGAQANEGPQVEQTPEGQQTLIPGVAPVTDGDRANAASTRAIDGGARGPDSNAGPLFDPGDSARTDLFSPEATAEPAASSPSEGLMTKAGIPAFNPKTDTPLSDGARGYKRGQEVEVTGRTIGQSEIVDVLSRKTASGALQMAVVREKDTGHIFDVALSELGEVLVDSGNNPSSFVSVPATDQEADKSPSPSNDGDNPASFVSVPEGDQESDGLTDAERARKAEILARFSDKFKNQTNAGLDPEYVALGAELAGIYIKQGVRKFRAMIDKFMEDTGADFDQAQPYVRNAYNQVRGDMDLDGADVSDMDTDQDVIEQIRQMRGAARSDGRPSPTPNIPGPEASGGRLTDPADIAARESQLITRAFAQKFQDGAKFKSIVQARKVASSAIGRDLTEADMKMVEEAIEAAVVARSRQIVRETTGSATVTFDQLTDLYGAQPRLAARTSTSVELQAYSTPAPLAFLASRIGQIGQASRVYEPTAGNGMLLMEVPSPNIIANEFQESRISQLRDVLGGEADIMQGDAMIQEVSSYTAAIANPPFGTVKDENVQTRVFDLQSLDGTTRDIDQAIVDKVLSGLPDDGRGVFIIGSQKGTTEGHRRREYQKDRQRTFFKSLYDTWNVTEHFSVDGRLYAKQGAGWPVDVIVVEGKGKSTRPYPMAEAPPIYEQWTDLRERLDGLESLDTRASRNGAGVRGAAIDGKNSDTGSVPGVSGRSDQTDGQPDGRSEGPGFIQSDGRNSGAADGAPGSDPRFDGGAERDTAPQVGDGQRGLAGDGQAGSQGDSGEPSPGAAGRVPSDPVSRKRVERENQEAETAFQVRYSPRSNARFAVGTVVPRNMQQAIDRALSTLSERVGDIDEYVAKELGYSVDELLGTEDRAGFFSAEQVDALALAIDNVGQNKGFIVGDQTGVGKGRFVAGMLRYALRQGRIPVFVTKDPALYADMVRDMRDIGMDDAHKSVMVSNTNLRGKNLIPLSSDEGDVLGSLPPKRYAEAVKLIRETGRLPDGLDMLFTSYHQMQTVAGKSTDRMAMLQAIAPNSMFVLDESHEAGGGSSDGQFKAKDAAPTRSEFIRDLLQNASGVVYSSATYAKNPSVMSLYSTTDLALMVDKPSDLPAVIEKGGVPLQQVLANMLVQGGQYARRERSYEGVSMELEQLETNAEVAARGAEAIRQLFRLDTEVMDDAREEFIEEQAKAGFGRIPDLAVGDAGAANVGFANVMHNLGSQLLLAAKTDAVAQKAIGLHRQGKKPIIALANTNASILSDVISERGARAGDIINVPFNVILDRYLERMRRITVKDEEENSHHLYMEDSDLDPYALQAFNEVKKFVSNLDLPGLSGAPIDTLLDTMRAAGMNAGEITGRSMVLEDSVLTPRDNSAAAKKRTMREFNQGDLDALVINRSGSTGFSLHATGADGNDAKVRHMLILQPEPNIDLFMQMLGRIHRTGQIKLPEYTIAVSDLAVEKRPAAVLMKKMASLNANTTGAKGSAVSLDVVDFLNKYGDEVVRDYLGENPEIGAMTAMKVGKDITNLAQKFTGRLITFPPDQVARIFDEIEALYTDKIDTLDKLGQNTLEAKVLPLNAETKTSTEIVEAKGGDSPFAQPAFVETVEVDQLGKPMTPDEIQDEIAKYERHMSEIEADIDAATPRAKERINEGLARAKERLGAAKTAKQKDAAQDAINRWNAKSNQLDATASLMKKRLSDMRVGRPGILQMSDGSGEEVFYAVPLEIQTKGLERAPGAMSAINVRFAIAAAGREVRMPLSKMFGEHSIFSWTALNDSGTDTALKAFVDGQTAQRETRQMVTGNVPAGFAQAQSGLITLYTDSNGQVKQGVLLPKKADLGRDLEKRPVRLPEASHVVKFLDGAAVNARQVVSEDGTLSISRSEDGYTLTAAAKGHKKYTLNKMVREILGDWNGRTGAKVHRARAKTREGLERALTVYAENLGTEYRAPSDRVAAREITGETLPDIPLMAGDAPLISEQRAATGTPDALPQPVLADLRAQLDRMALKRVDLGLMEGPGQGRLERDAEGMRILVGASLDPEATIRHEAIHALRAMNVFTDPEWKALTQRANSIWMKQHDIKGRYPDLDAEAQIEEAIAEGFAAWRPNMPASPIKAAFAKVRRFLRALGDVLRGRGSQTAEDVFARVESGEIGSRAGDGSGPDMALEQRQEASNAAQSEDIGEQVTDTVDEGLDVDERQETFLRAAMKQPIDTAFRSLFYPVGGIDQFGRWRVGKSIHDQIQKTVVNRRAKNLAPISFLDPVIETIRHGVIDRYGLPDDYVDADRRRGLRQAAIATEGREHLEALAKANVSAAESKVLQAILTGETVDDKAMQSLAHPIREAIDFLGEEAVQAGILSREAYTRNRGSYLHRVYAKHEFDEGKVSGKINDWVRGRRQKLIGKQLKGRGIFKEAKVSDLMRNSPAFLKHGRPQKGDKVIIFDLVVEKLTEGLGDIGAPQGRVRQRVYHPASKPVPESLNQHQNRGTFEVRDIGKGKVTLWRDYTKDERTKMGEVLDARYTIAKTYSLMANDIATGKFFKEVAENDDWVKSEPPEGATVDEDPQNRPFRTRMLVGADPQDHWIKVPTAKIPKSDTPRYGALAGQYVRSDLWRDMAELDRINSPTFWDKLMTIWKLNKTARNPVVHMNNVMSNFMLMDMADVTMPDLVKAVRQMMSQGDDYKAASEAGAFGSDMIQHEFNRDVLGPLMQELADEARGNKTSLEAQIGSLGKFMDRLYRAVKIVDDKMVNAYQMEDQVFRLATFIKRREQGMDVSEAAIEARDQFLNYDIRAPWINAARRTVLPFISYTYRAVPKLFETMTYRPWKIAKYAAIAHGLNAMGYLLGPSEYDEEEERGSLDDREQGNTWVGTPRLIRLPFLANDDLDPVFLDTRRWIPAGDVFDMSQGDLPPWMHIGGPLVLAGEAYYNRALFTGRDIVNPITDTAVERAGKRAMHLYQGMAPGAFYFPFSYHWTKIGRSLSGEGRDAAGDPYRTSDALMGAIGIKARPKDVESGYEWHRRDFERTKRELDYQEASLRRLFQRGLISREKYERQIRDGSFLTPSIMEKHRRNREDLEKHMDARR